MRMKHQPGHQHGLKLVLAQDVFQLQRSHAYRDDQQQPRAPPYSGRTCHPREALKAVAPGVATNQPRCSSQMISGT